MPTAVPKDLTDARLRALKPRKERYDLRDKTGLLVRVEPSRRITFYSEYRLHGQRRLLKHGQYGPGAMSLAKAREAHAHTLAQVASARRGTARDPAAQRDAEQAEARLADTVEGFAQTYLDLHAKPRKRSWATDERILRVDVLPYVGKTKLKDLTQANIVAVLDRIDRRGARNQSWQTLKIVRRMLNFAVSRGALGGNPAAGIKRDVTYQAKQRALSDAELVGLFQALPDLKMQAAVADLLLFQLHTAVRPSEARLATWEEIDMASRCWTIPATRMKMAREHVVPLSAAAVEILQRRQACGTDGFVFAGERAGKPYNLQVLGHALRRQENQQTLKRRGVAFFTPHDVRRTAATIMRRLGFGLVVDRVLAHAAQSVTDRHYDVHDYEPEKRNALEALAAHLAALQAKARGENVTVGAFRKG